MQRQWLPILSMLVPLVAACGGAASPVDEGAPAAVGLPAVDPAGIDAAYLAEIGEWRARREKRLRDPEGYLTLVGLHWLEPGDNRFGSDPSNEIVLPADQAPPFAGKIQYDGRIVRLAAEPGAGLTVNGAPAESAFLSSDYQGGKPDQVRLGRLRFHVIRRGERHAIRVKDPESPVLTGFSGVDYFPVHPGYAVTARLEAYDEPRDVEVPTVLGEAASMKSKGVVAFELGDETYRLEALVNDPEDTELFLIFRDGTTGDESYGGGRYLYAPSVGERVDLDFNRAYNPPCAFTPYATCPLPPPRNRLALRVEAGEKAYGSH